MAIITIVIVESDNNVNIINYIISEWCNNGISIKVRYFINYVYCSMS